MIYKKHAPRSKPVTSSKQLSDLLFNNCGIQADAEFSNGSAAFQASDVLAQRKLAKRNNVVNAASLNSLTEIEWIAEFKRVMSEKV